MTAAAADRVMQQALALPREKQRVLLGRLWDKLEWGHQLPPSLKEIERRVASIRNGTALTSTAEEVRKSIEQRIKTAKSSPRKS